MGTWPTQYVGQVTTGDVAKEGAELADAYTYGAVSKGLSEGQAAQAWNELKKQQNFPQVQQVQSDHPEYSCPSGFLFAPDGATCVNQEMLHIGRGINCGQAAQWWVCAPLVGYVTLNEREAMASGSLAKVTDAAMRGLRALRMTTGSYGWTNVRSQLRAVAWMVTTTPGHFADEYGEGWAPFDGPDVDELQEMFEKSIAPYYDKDVANPAGAKAAGDAIIADLLESQHQRMRLYFGESLLWSVTKIALALAVGGALGLYLLERPLFFSLLRRGTSFAAHLPQQAAQTVTRVISR